MDVVIGSGEVVERTLLKTLLATREETGMSVVVHYDSRLLLDGQELSARNRTQHEWLWSEVSGDTVVVNGQGATLAQVMQGLRDWAMVKYETL